MKAKGFILFAYQHGFPVEISEDLYINYRDLERYYRNIFGDKWDYDDRHKIHYFYLDLSTGKYTALPKWKNKPNVDASFSSDKEVVLSTKIFGNKAGELNDNRL